MEDRQPRHGLAARVEKDIRDSFRIVASPRSNQEIVHGGSYAASGCWRTAARSCQPTSRRRVIWPLRKSPKSRNRTASSLGSEAWVLVRRRNSSLIRSSALVVRSAFHCEEGKPVKVKSSSPASSKLALTALQRSFHLRRKPTRACSTASRLGA